MYKINIKHRPYKNFIILKEKSGNIWRQEARLKIHGYACIESDLCFKF